MSSTSKIERVYTSLIRDINGSLGFSISGGKGKEQFIEGDDSVYISKVAEAGPAHRDGKIQVGDKLVQVKNSGDDFNAFVVKYRAIDKCMQLRRYTPKIQTQ